MIMRIFQVQTHPGQEAAFARFFHETAIPMMRATDGLVQILPGAAREDSPRDFCFVMIWRDLDALKAFVGEDYQAAHVDPAEVDLVAHRTIHHYELVEQRGVVTRGGLIAGVCVGCDAGSGIFTKKKTGALVSYAGRAPGGGRW